LLNEEPNFVMSVKGCEGTVVSGRVIKVLLVGLAAVQRLAQSLGLRQKLRFVGKTRVGPDVSLVSRQGGQVDGFIQRFGRVRLQLKGDHEGHGEVISTRRPLTRRHTDYHRCGHCDLHL